MKNWLDKYQKGSQVKTYASDPSYFDNRAVFVDNPQSNDLIRSKVYAGTHGWDPTTNSLVKLDKPVAVPKAVQEMSTADWGKKSHQERVESKTPAGKATRKAIAAREMEQAVTNPYFRGAIPTMLLPGLPALGEAAYAGIMASPIGAATAGALGSSVAPGLTYGTLGQGLFDSYWASKAMTEDMPTAFENFRSGDTKEGLINTGMAAMNLAPFARIPLSKAAEAAAPYFNTAKTKVKDYFTPRKMEMDWDTGEYFQTGKKNAGDVIGELSDRVRRAAYAKQGSKYQFGKEDLPMRVATDADLKRLNEIEEAVSLTSYGMDETVRNQSIQNLVSKSSLTDDELMLIYGKNRDEILSHPIDQPLVRSKYDAYGNSIYGDTNPLLQSSSSSMGWRDVPQKLTTSELKKYYKGINSKPEASIYDAQEIVPHLAAYQFKNKRHMLTSLKEALDTKIKDAKVGDLLIGSTNTSYNSWLPQMDFIFKNAGKNGLSKPVFLGYQSMNQMGFITDAATRGVKIRPAVFMDYLTKGLNTIQKRSPIGLDLQKHAPFIDPKNGSVMLPMYGVRKINNNFTNIKKRDGGWLSSYDSMTPAWSKNPEGNWVAKAQKGLQYTAEPTRADSLELLKNARLVQNYYNSKNYNKNTPIYYTGDLAKDVIFGAVEEDHETYDPNAKRTTPTGLQPVPLNEYYKPVDKNKFYQREFANGILDTRAPMQLYDRRILPTAQYSYENATQNDPLHGDNVGLIGYDPISITPWDMLTDKQKKLRVKRFGRDGVPENYDPDRPSVPKNISYKDVQLLQQPEDRLIREYTTQELNPKYRRVYDKSPYSIKEYGPEGQPTHWAKEDEKISGVWRPVKGTPSDLIVSKKVKMKSGGWLDTYQVGSEVKTYANDPSYFDNRAVYHDDPRFNDLIRAKVYAGTHGWDPKTNSLVKLDKPVSVPEATREMSTSDWGKKSHQERIQSNTPAGKATRKAVAAREMEQAVTNPYFRGAIPAMMLPGVPALGEAAYAGLMSTPIGAATAGALATDVAPGLTVGTLGQGLVDSYFAAKAPGQLMTANQNFRSGDITEGAANTALAAMNLFPFYQYMPKAQGPGPLMILDDAGKGVSRAKGDEPHLSEWQKLRIAEGKPVYTGSGQQGNMTMREIQAQKDLQKSVKSKTKPKKLSKEEEYERLLRESYQRTGGSIKGYQDGGDYSKIPQSWKDKYGWTPNVEEEYQKFKNDYMAPENLKFTDDINDYNTRGMWDSLDRPSDWQQALALYKQQQGEDWTPEEDGYYHAWSQHPGTGEWLKPKHHSTGWMNYMGYAFDPENTAVVNPEGFFGNETLQAYPRQKKKGGVKSSAEGYYDYINGYSGIFAQGGTKGWLDNYK
jgi:hypothetical protein